MSLFKEKPVLIILHHSLTKDSGTVSWQAIRRYHMDVLGWDDNGYHYGIELINGRYESLNARFMDTIGAHCRGYNSKSIGVCLIGNFDLEPVPAEQWDLALALVRGLCFSLDIPSQSVLGHREFNSKKSCPGRYFNLNVFRKDLTLQSDTTMPLRAVGKSIQKKSKSKKKKKG